jgi:hypothetical protein
MEKDGGWSPAMQQTARHKRSALQGRSICQTAKAQTQLANRGEVAQGRKVGKAPPLLLDVILRQH